MKYIITITILATIALCINHIGCSNVKWQRSAEKNWHDMLDPLYSPKKVDKIIESCKAINYVIAQEKYYRGK